MNRRVIRVFPRKTKATPTDELAYIGDPDLFAEADQVLISVTFTMDIPEAERLARAWAPVAPVTVGGPAMGDPGGDFEPGLFLRKGYVITSRGCPNSCWFCDVWSREGAVRELPITNGWNVQDPNLLACSSSHVRRVFQMLQEQEETAVFAGGLEAARLRPWHIELLSCLKPRPTIWMAYDTPNDLEPLREACKLLSTAGWTYRSRRLYCYVLCGFPGDSICAAEKRCMQAIDAGCTPFAMLYTDDDWTPRDRTVWKQWQRLWSRPAIIHTRVKA